MVYDNIIRLSLPVQPGICLLIQFQGPIKAKPYYDVSTRLEIESVSGTCRMRQEYIYLPLIPLADYARALKFRYPKSLRKALDDTGLVMLEVIEYQYRLPLAAFHNLLECLQLLTMDLHCILVIVIYRAITELEELPGQHSRGSRIQRGLVHLQKHLLLKLLIGYLLLGV